MSPLIRCVTRACCNRDTNSHGAAASFCAMLDEPHLQESQHRVAVCDRERAQDQQYGKSAKQQR
jgi:hypothetical protein